MAEEDGVVAIVQALKDTGLAVTVLNRRLLRNRCRNDNSFYRKPLASRSSVETNTDKSYSDFYKNKDTSASVRDGHYASSYQIAHCNARPTSPQSLPHGFPPQRLKPSRTEGNFEVGGYHGVWDTLTSPPRGHGAGMGCSDRSFDSGSTYANRCERLSHETFAHSLRRYPTCSPERSISSELVQKLLNYTQNKHLTKSISNKSQRSLNREKSPQSLKLEVKPSKNIQTYTRTRTNRDVLTRDCGANTSRDLKFMTKKRRSFSTFREKRYKDEYINTSYDYLDYPAVSHFATRRTNEVRYLRDVKKYIHDTIRQIYDEPMGACQNIEIQASAPATSTCTHCVPPAGSHTYLHFYTSATTSDIMCCRCNKPRPCICELKTARTTAAYHQNIAEWVDELPMLSENARDNQREKEQVIKELTDLINKVPKDENNDENVRNAITTYIESLPIWDLADDEDDDAYKKGIIDNIMNRLASLEDKTADAVKDIVRKWLQDIQFDRNIDMNKNVDIFAAHLTPLLNDISELKAKLKELLESLPITNKEDVIKEIHFDLLNDLIELSARTVGVLTEEELENEVNEFMQDHPDILNQADKVKNLVRKLKNIQSKPTSQSEKEEKMKANVVDWIDTLPKSTKDKFTPTEKEEFSNDLIEKIQDASNLKAANDKRSSLQTLNEIENEIWGLLESMDVDPSYVDEPIVKEYALNLKEMKNSDFDEQDFANRTIDFLNDLDKSGIPMTARNQDRFQEKVLIKLKGIKDKQSGGGKQSSFVTSTPRKGKAPPGRDFNVSSIDEEDDSRYSIAGPSGLKSPAEDQYNNELIEEIESWVETLPINLDREKKHKKVMFNDLANDIIDRQKYLQIHPNATKSDQEELDHLKYQVFRWLNKMDDVKNNEIAPVMDKTKNLMDRIKKIDIPRFNKSSLRTPSKEKKYESQAKEQKYGLPTKEHRLGSLTRRVGSPTKVNRVESPTRVNRVGSPTREKNSKERSFSSPTTEENFGAAPDEKGASSPGEKRFSSPQREQNFDSSPGGKSFVSPQGEQNFGSSPGEKRFNSPQREQNFGSSPGENSFGSPQRKQNFGSSPGEKSFGSPQREQNFGSSSGEKRFGSPQREQNFGSSSGGKRFGSPQREQNFDSSPNENSFGSPTRQQNFGSAPGVKNIGSPTRQQNFGSSPGEKSFGSPQREQNFDSLPGEKSFGLSPDEKSFGLPTRQQNYGSSPGEKSFGSPQRVQNFGSSLGEKSFDSPTRQQNYGSAPGEKNIGSPTRQQNFGSSPGEKSFGSPQREQNFASLPGEKSFGSSPDEKSFGSPTRQQNLGSSPGEKSFGSPQRAQNFDSSPDEKSFGSPTIQQNYGSAPGEKNIGSPTRQQNFESSPDEKSFGSPTRQQNFGSSPGEKSFGSSQREQNYGSSPEEKTFGSPQRVQNFGSSPGEKSFGSPQREQNFGSSPEEKTFGSPTRQQNFGSSSREKKPTGQQSAGSHTDEQSFGNKTYIPTQNTSMFIKENLDGAITDWIKQLPLYETASPEQKQKFKEIAQDISIAIKRVNDVADNSNQDINKLVADEIEKQMQNLPLSPEDKKDKKIMKQAAAQLQQYLKDQQMFQDISERKEVPYDEYLKQSVDDWAKSLSLSPSEKVKFDNLKDKFTSILKKAREDKVDPDTMKIEINKLLKELSLKDIRNKDYQDSKVEELLKALATVPVATTSRISNIHHFVEPAIATWIEKLPLESGKNVTDIRKGAVKNMENEISDALVLSDESARVKKVIEGATIKFLDEVPLDPKKAYDKKALANDLFVQIKDIPKGLLKRNPTSNDVGSSKRNSRYDEPITPELSRTTIQTNLEDTEKVVNNFANNLSLVKGTWSEKKKFGKLKSELATKLNEMMNNNADPDALKKEIKYYLSRFPFSEDERRDDRFLEKQTEVLMKSLLINNNDSPDEYSHVRKGFLKWVNDLPFDEGKTVNDIPKEAIDHIARRLSNQIIHTDAVSLMETKKIIAEETSKFLQKTPLDKNISHDEKQMAQDLFDCIRGRYKGKSKPTSTEVSVPTSPSILKPSTQNKTAEVSTPTSFSNDKTVKVSTETLFSHKSGSMHPSFKSAADQLADNVEQWVNNLPIKEHTPEEKSKASNLRRYLASRIISKVSELNSNPEVFNDDFLYEEMFEDDVDNLITALSSEDLIKKMPPHKKNLIEIVKDARLKTQEEMAGTVYKQLLRDAVSKKVPSESLDENENASFEVLKEDVADAFVSLHYNRGNKESKTQFKNNIKNEIDVFCADYLKNHPKAAVDIEKLNNDLYKALKDVPAPKDETMRHEIEIIKIKEVINQWINEGKLFGRQTGVDRLKTKKKISVLAKKIHDIEKLKENNPDFDPDDMLKNEIQKWLQKMPLVVKDDLGKLAEQLIKKLKETEEWRKSLESDSSGKESILPASSYTTRTESTPIDSSSPLGGSSRLPASSFSTCTGSGGARISRSPKPTVSSSNILRPIVSPSKAYCTCTGAPVIPARRLVKAKVSGPTTTESSTAPEYTIVPTPCAPPCAIPPSTLSSEDRDYLKRIRERATQSMTLSSPKPSKDAAVSPIPVDYGSQTEIPADITHPKPQAQSSPRQAKASCCQTSEPVETCKPQMQTAGSQVEVVPHIIVKEYYWDSVNSKMTPCSKTISCTPSPYQQCPQIPEVIPPPRPCPARVSHHSQTPPALYPEECDLDCQEYPYYSPDIPKPCTSRQKSSHHVGPKIKGSNRNLTWSKEEFYGDRREPSDEEEIIIDPEIIRKLNCRCKDRVTNQATKKRSCKSCRMSNEQTLRRCPKCCGVHCPFPSYFYFN